LGTGASFPLVPFAFILDAVDGPAPVCFARKPFSKASATANSQIGAPHRGGVHRCFRLRSHPPEVQGEPGVVPTVELVPHPGSRPVARLVAPGAPAVGPLDGHRDAPSQSIRIGESTAKHVGIQIAVTRLDEGVGACFPVPQTGELDDQLAHGPQESHTLDSHQAHTVEVCNSSLQRKDLESVSDQPDTPAAHPERGDGQGSAIIAGHQGHHPWHLRHELRQGRGPGGHDLLLVPDPHPRPPTLPNLSIQIREVVEDRVDGRAVRLLSQPQSVCQRKAVGNGQAVPKRQAVRWNGIGSHLRFDRRGGAQCEEQSDEGPRKRPSRASESGHIRPKRVHDQPARLLTHSTRRRAGKPYPPLRR
jgi:hypothetical protein